MLCHNIRFFIVSPLKFLREKEVRHSLLIVEDEGLIAFEMMEFLAREGYCVLDPVSSGEEAIKRCSNSPSPDLILMDVVLPGRIDGIEAARRIRNRFQVPVIILTACEDGKMGIRLKELAPEGYLVKPSPREDLLAAISLVLQSQERKNSVKAGERQFGDS